MFCLLVFITLSLFSYTTRKTYSNNIVINTPSTEDVTIYVSGDTVTKTDTGYEAEVGKSIKVFAINGRSIFKSMKIGENTYDTPIVEITVEDASNLNISVETIAPTAENRGEYFANPFIISSGDDILALSRILDNAYDDESTQQGITIESDYERFDLTPSVENKLKLQRGYFRLTSNIVINSDNFFGIGNRNVPFMGSFDFNGNYVYFSVNKTKFSTNEFVDGRMDIGLFSLIYGDDHPCLIKNADVRGTIAVKTETINTDGGDLTSERSISIGGLAGTSGKNVIFDGVTSQVSISADVKTASLELGGVVGFLSSNIEDWSNVSYKGTYGTITGITKGERASVYVGGLCGVLQNTYVRNFLSDAQSSNFVATSYGSDNVYNSGSSFSGGMAGVIYSNPSSRPEMSPVNPMIIEKIRLRVNSDFVVTSVIDNQNNTLTNRSNKAIDSDNFTSNSSGAVAGGLVGTIYSSNESGGTITLSDLKIINETTISDMKVIAQTVDADSNGAVFAGGLVGYIYTSGIDKIKYKASKNISEDNPSYIFATSTSIRALQNGTGPAYAGGIFGYNAFNFESNNPKYYFRMVDQDSNIDVSAVQSLISNKEGSILYDVMAGFYSSKLQNGYSLKNFNLSVSSGSVTAERESGTNSIGNICAGGIAGFYDGSIKSGSSTISVGQFTDVTLDFTPSVSISSLGYSYESNYTGGTTKIGNNVCVGGAIGYIKEFTSNTITDITVNFNGVSNKPIKPISIQGVQNAVSGDADYATEGYVGGVFGMYEDSKASNINFFGNNNLKSLVRFYSTNDPNTASVGGAIGATRQVDFKYTIDTLVVKSAHVVGRAFCENTNDNDQYDLFVGGAVGVLGAATEGVDISGTQALNFYVYDSIIESVGDENMLTYAGGVFGGIWYIATIGVKSCYSIRNSVTATSVNWKSYAGGLAGLAQACVISNSKVLETSVYVASNNQNVQSSSAV